MVALRRPGGQGVRRVGDGGERPARSFSRPDPPATRPGGPPRPRILVADIPVSFSRFLINRPAAPASRARPAVPLLPGPPEAPRLCPRVPGSMPASLSAAFAAPDFAGLRRLPMLGMTGRRDDGPRRPRAGRWTGLPAGRANRAAPECFGVWVRVGIDSPLVDQIWASYPQSAWPRTEFPSGSVAAPIAPGHARRRVVVGP